MPVVIVRAVRTCRSCPSQWDAWDDSGQYDGMMDLEEFAERAGLELRLG